MDHYGDGEIIQLEHYDKIIQQLIHHQFKYLVLIGVTFRKEREDGIGYIKRMDHYGDGEALLMED